MAADIYIRSAIIQLQSALTDLQGQMHGLQQHTHESKQRMQQDITRLEQERTVHSVELERLQNDTQKHLVLSRIDHLNRQRDDLHAQMSRLDTELAGALQRKTVAYNKLHDLAQQLDLLMASPDLH